MMPSDRQLPPGWREERSEHGFPFYVHEGRGVVTWESPLDQAATSWIARVDAGERAYYYNPVSGEKCGSDGSEWVQSADDQGVPLFFNLLTRETTYDPPPAILEAAPQAPEDDISDDEYRDEYYEDSDGEVSARSSTSDEGATARAHRLPEAHLYGQAEDKEELEEEEQQRLRRPPPPMPSMDLLGTAADDSEDEEEDVLTLARNVFGKVFDGSRWTRGAESPRPARTALWADPSPAAATALAGVEDRVARTIAQAAERSEVAIDSWVAQLDEAQGAGGAAADTTPAAEAADGSGRPGAAEAVAAAATQEAAGPLLPRGPGDPACGLDSLEDVTPAGPVRARTTPQPTGGSPVGRPPASGVVVSPPLPGRSRHFDSASAVRRPDGDIVFSFA